MSGMRFEFGVFQETELPKVATEEELENTLSNLTSQSIEPVVDTDVPEPVEASIPAWVWFLLIPVVLPLFLLLFRGKGNDRPASSSRRLDLRAQPEGAKYRERVAPSLEIHDAPSVSNEDPGTDVEDAPEFGVEPEFASSDDEFDECGGFDFELDDVGTSDSRLVAAPTNSPEPIPMATARLSAESVAIQDNNGQLSEVLVALQKELATAVAHLEEGRANDKLPHLEQELEAMTRDIGELQKVNHRLQQERVQLNDELVQERSAKNELVRQYQTLETRIADTSAADTLSAKVKTLTTENQTLTSQLGSLQESNDSLSQQLAVAQGHLSEAQDQIAQGKRASVPVDDPGRIALVRKLAEKRKLLVRIQEKLRDKLELIEKLKKQIADSSPV